MARLSTVYSIGIEVTNGLNEPLGRMQTALDPPTEVRTVFKVNGRELLEITGRTLEYTAEGIEAIKEMIRRANAYEDLIETKRRHDAEHRDDRYDPMG
jgi:hypothetical protein